MRSPRVLWFALALLLFGIFTFIARRQAPRPDPFQPVQALSWDWWQYPLERNAFKRLPVITSSLNDVFALPNSEKVWTVGDDGMIVHSEDGGETWVQQEVDWEAVADSQLSRMRITAKDLEFDSSKALSALIASETADGARKQVSSTKNFDLPQSQTNAPVRTPATQPTATTVWPPRLFSVHFVDAVHGWAVGSRGIILATRDGGKSWLSQTANSRVDLSAVYFVNATRGWVIGDKGTIITTRNGGTDWELQQSNSSIFFTSIYFVDESIGWVGGEELLSTTDGGQNWQKYDGEVFPANFLTLHFINAQIGWAAGELTHLGGSKIFKTTNSGKSWQKQLGGIEVYSSIQFLNSEIGWAVSRGGKIATTTNGGQNWDVHDSGINRLRSIHFSDVLRGWAVGRDGAILATRDGGKNWRLQTSGPSAQLNSVHFSNITHGWAVGGNGNILSTSNGGQSWQSHPDRTNSDLFSSHFITLKQGWAVGLNKLPPFLPPVFGENFGVILVTSDGGLTWKIETGQGDDWSPLRAIHFVNASAGWAVGDEGIIITTKDGGRSWQKQTSGMTATLHSVHFVNETTGWAFGKDGIILATQDGGQNWQEQMHDPSLWLFSGHFINSTTGWAVGNQGIIIDTNDGGTTWKKQNSPVSTLLSSVHFVNENIGWTIGESGTILTTQDGGQNWTRQTSDTKALLQSIQFVDSKFGFIVGDQNTILATNNSGQTWNRIKYSRSFAPWYYLFLFIITPLLYLAFRKPKPIEAEQKTVADMLVSDRPIAAGDPDPLEFNAIARGLSRFLRNENTQPPLTIAITGEWGSGKSSLMNLLKADLERYGFRPVSFNAWHHQKEEHLLAALLQNIRKQAVPSLWHRGGLAFRSRLLWERTRRYWMLALLLLALFSFAVGYFVVDHPARMHQAWEKAGEIEKDLFAFLFSKTAPDSASSPQNAERVESAKDEKEKRVSFFTLLLSTLGSLFVLWRWLRAFGVDPASLMASISDKARLRDLKAQMGFRHDFAREFSEVTAALNPRTMLILIDDLDRCRPENVLEVLEAVNFLVSSGDCFVVLGLDLQRVERCVGLGFKDVAEELVDQTSLATNSEKEEAKNRRAEFARQYLEKLINIEVSVPQPQPEQSQNLIVPPEPVVSKPLLWWQNLLQKTMQVVRKTSPWLLAAAVVVGGFWFGIKNFSPQGETQGATTVSPTTTPSPAPSNQSQPSTPTTQPTRRDAPADSSRGTGELIQPVKEPTSFTFVYIVLALMFGLGIWRLSIPTDLVVKDSPEFIDALKIWHPVLIAKHNTPRSVKRFVNRVRYFAMRQSAETEVKSVWQKLLIWAGLNLGEETKQVNVISESILVALSAMSHYNPKWINDNEVWKDFGEEFKVIDHVDGKMIAVIFDAVAEHYSRFGSWPPNEKDRERLLKLSAGIRIN